MGQTGVQMLGYVGQINGAELGRTSRRATSSGTSTARAGSRTSTRAYLRGDPGSTRWR